MESDNATETRVVRGRPFQPGNPGGPGRPKKGHAIRDYVRRRPGKDKQAVVAVAFQEVLENHDVAWANWLLKAEGEDGPHTGVARELIIREYQGWPEQIS